MSEKVEFSFRVWVYPEDSDPAEFDIWWYGFEPTNPSGRFVTEWVRESFSNEDFHDLFKLDKDKHWQVIGRASLRGWYSYDGEYDEELEVIEFQKVEVPSQWFKVYLRLDDE